MLGETRCAEHVRILVGRSDLLQFGHARIDDAGVELCALSFVHHVLRRALNRLVKLRQRTVNGNVGVIARLAVLNVAVLSGKEAGDALAVHAERLLSARGVRSLRAVADIGDIVAVPHALFLVPPDEFLPRPHRFAVLVTGGSVIQHVNVVRPDPGEVRIDAHAALVLLPAAPRHMDAVAVDTGEDPHARHRRAVVADLANAAQEMAVL